MKGCCCNVCVIVACEMVRCLSFGSGFHPFHLLIRARKIKFYSSHQSGSPLSWIEVSRPGATGSLLCPDPAFSLKAFHNDGKSGSRAGGHHSSCPPRAMDSYRGLDQGAENHIWREREREWHAEFQHENEGAKFLICVAKNKHCDTSRWS